MKNVVLILDFGSQYTQLIARRIREMNVYCEIVPYNLPIKDVDSVAAVIWSGGPSSVYEDDVPHVSSKLFELNKPILGICYGMQAIVDHFGGHVRSGKQGEFGRAKIEITEGSLIFKGVPRHSFVW